MQELLYKHDIATLFIIVLALIELPGVENIKEGNVVLCRNRIICGY